MKGLLRLRYIMVEDAGRGATPACFCLLKSAMNSKSHTTRTLTIH